MMMMIMMMMTMVMMTMMTMVTMVTMVKMMMMMVMVMAHLFIHFKPSVIIIIVMLRQTDSLLCTLQSVVTESPW